MSRQLCKTSNEQILTYLKKTGSATATGIREACGQCRRAALRRLIRLESLGVIKTSGVISTNRNTNGPTTVFVLVNPELTLDELKAISTHPATVKPKFRVPKPSSDTVFGVWR